MSIDLSLVPAKDLADEIMRRSECGVIIFTTLEANEVYVNWMGDYYKALGMCTEMQDYIINDEKEGANDS